MDWYCGGVDASPVIADGKVNDCFRGPIFDGPPSALLVIGLILVCTRLCGTAHIAVPLYLLDSVRFGTLIVLALSSPFLLLIRGSDSTLALVPVDFVDALALRMLPAALAAALVWTEARRATMRARAERPRSAA